MACALVGPIPTRYALKALALALFTLTTIFLYCDFPSDDDGEELLEEDFLENNPFFSLDVVEPDSSFAIAGPIATASAIKNKN